MHLVSTKKARAGAMEASTMPEKKKKKKTEKMKYHHAQFTSYYPKYIGWREVKEVIKLPLS